MWRDIMHVKVVVFIYYYAEAAEYKIYNIHTQLYTALH